MSAGKITRYKNNIRIDGDLDLSQLPVGGTKTGYLTLSALSSAPSSPTVGAAYYDSTLGKARIYQGSGWSGIDGTAAGSLDAAYDGGAIIAVDGGAVTLTDSQTNTTGGLLITKSGIVASSSSNSIFHINSTATHTSTGTMKMIELSCAADSGSQTQIGIEAAMPANTDSAITITKGAVTLTDGAMTLSSGAFSVTGAVTIVGATGITGTFAASGASTLAAINNSGTITSQGIVIIDADNAEAFLIRTDGDAADVLTIDTTGDAGDTTMLLTPENTTGTGLHVDGSTITTGDALKVTVAAATMEAAGAAISVVADGTEVFAVRDDGSVYSKSTAEGTTAFQIVAGDLLVSDGDFTVGGGESSFTDGITTTGVGFAIASTATTAGVSLGEAGPFILTANSLTTGTALVVRANAITTGDMLYLDAGGGTMTATTGFFINCNDDNASKFTVSSDGRTVIAGTATGTAALTITAGDIVMSAGGIALTDTGADQFGILYDASNHFKVDVDVDGSTTLTTTGTNADIAVVSGTAGDITLTAAGDIILEATGADVTSNAPINITSTSSQLELINNAGLKTTFTVAATTANCTILTAGGTENVFEVVATTIILDSAGDIDFQAAGADISMDAQLTITATAADQLVLAYDGSNTFGIDVDVDGSTTLTTTGTNADFEIASGTTGDITLNSTGAIILESTGVTSDSTITVTKTSGNLLGLKYDASNHLAITVANDGLTTLTTTGTDADFEIASGTAGDITLDATADIVMQAAGADITMDAQLTITTAANEAGFVMINNTITTTGPLMDISSTSVTTASMLKLNANTAASDGTILEIVSAGDTSSTPTGISVTAAAVTSGVAKGIAVSMALATTTAKGISVTMDAISTGDMLYLDQSASDTMTAGSGFYINANRNNTSDFTVSKYGATTIAGTAAGTDALTLTLGDILVSEGHLDMTVGDMTLGDGSISITDADNATSVTVINNTITTTGPMVSLASSSLTTASAFYVNASSVNNEGAILELLSSGGATKSPTGILITIASPTTGAARGIDIIMAGAQTTAVGVRVKMDAITTGDMLYLDNGGNTMTGDGKFIHCNDDNATKFAVAANGATTITGSAAGTTALTLTAGDLVITDTDASTISSVNGTTTLLTLDNADGAVGSGAAVLKVDAGGVVNAAGYGILATFSGAAAAGATVVGIIPDAGSKGLFVNAGGVVTAEALYIDADPTTTSVAYMHTDAIIAQDKAVLELHADTGESNADSSVLRIDQANLTGASYGATIVQADLDVGFVNFEGTASGDELSPISTLNTGAITDHVRCAINGSIAWIPVVTGALS